jgi:hypothetical protein
VNSEANLLEIVGALCFASGFAGRLNGRQHERHEYADDRHDDQNLNQRKSRLAGASTVQYEDSQGATIANCRKTRKTRYPASAILKHISRDILRLRLRFKQVNYDSRQFRATDSPICGGAWGEIGAVACYNRHVARDSPRHFICNILRAAGDE